MKQRGEANLHLILTIFLGLGMVIFGVLAVLAYNNNATTQTNTHNLENQAASTAQANQKKQDDIANSKANELPYRTYTADPAFGSFQLQIPKDWSLYVGENGTNGSSNGNTVLDLAAGPDQVVYNLGTSSSGTVINTFALRVRLENQTIAQVTQNYEAQIKANTVIGKSVTVSGIASTWLEGAIDNERHNGIVVLVPTRTQTMVIETDSHDYVDEFNTILSTAKIYP
jgi:cytoskeletal protein RodZ